MAASKKKRAAVEEMDDANEQHDEALAGVEGPQEVWWRCYRKISMKCGNLT